MCVHMCVSVRVSCNSPLLAQVKCLFNLDIASTIYFLLLSGYSPDI